jgi:hypothetical protein
MNHTLTLVGLITASLAAQPARETRMSGGEKSLTLTKEQASAFAKLALKGLTKEYPNKPGDRSPG